MNRLHLRLTIDLTVKPNGVPTADLLEILDYAAAYLASNGLFSGETPAEVEEWTSKSEEVTPTAG